MKRREFLKAAGTGAAAVAITGPSIVPGSVFGAYAPSNRINVGFIGLGNQSTIDLPAFLNNDDVQVVAVCDVNTASYGYRDAKQFLGRKPGQESVEKHYAKQAKSGSYAGCRSYKDYRELLARDDIDAVAIVVPDHWHAIMTVEAARAGKDIYCEKPLALTVQQGQEMVKAVYENNRILQTGSQHRSGPSARLACELVRNGRIGKLERIKTTVPVNNALDPGPGWKPEPVPEGFDYDLWLGPAPWTPYHAGRCFYRFRFNLDYSGGQVTNFGAHAFDIAQAGHGSDRSGPIEFEDTGSIWPPAGSLYNVATKVSFRARYADGVELTCVTEENHSYTRFEGTEGWVQYSSGKIQTYPESLRFSKIGPNEIHLPVGNPRQTEDKYTNYLPDHVRNFLDCIKSREQPIGPVDIGHRTASICNLGNIAMRLKRPIRWNPEAEEIIGDDEATALLSRPMRAPWHL
jgi:predicted dehydrogenase